MTLTCELVRDFAPIYVISKQKADICNSFYRATRMHSADYAVARCLSVRQSVCQSVTRRYSVETAKHIFKLFSPHVSHTILVFFTPNGITIFRRNPLTEASNAWGHEKSRFSTNISLKHTKLYSPYRNR